MVADRAQIQTSYVAAYANASMTPQSGIDKLVSQNTYETACEYSQPEGQVWHLRARAPKPLSEGYR